MTDNPNDNYRTGPRRQYDEAFMRHAVALSMQPGRNVRAIARELGISQSMLYRWRDRYHGRPALPLMTVPEPRRSLSEAEAEIRRLQTELLRMQERETILKKSLGILSETPGSGMPRSKH